VVDKQSYLNSDSENQHVLLPRNPSGDRSVIFCSILNHWQFVYYVYYDSFFLNRFLSRSQASLAMHTARRCFGKSANMFQDLNSSPRPILSSDSFILFLFSLIPSFLTND
jgi:hypothetical protein